MFGKLTKLEDNFTITKAAVIVGILTLLTKFLAIYRERLFASTFGQDKILDTYFSGFRIPDFITNIFILSTLSVAFLPIFTELLTRDKKKGMEVANIVLNWICVVIGSMSIILLIFSEPITKLLVPGYTSEKFELTLNFTRLFLLSPLLFAISTIMGGYLNSLKKFLITSFAPILYNLGIIFGVIYFYPKYGIIGLGYGVIAGAVIQLMVQIVFSIRNGFTWKPNFNFYDINVQKVFKLYLPRLLAFDLSNITLLLGTILGSFLVEGSIASLNQAYNLQAVPVGVFAYALALAAFTPLSEYYAVKDEKKYTLTLLKVLKQIMFFMVPMTIIMLLYRAYIVRLVLGFGKFSWDDTVRTLTVLGIFSFSLLTQSLTTILSRAFFARQNTKIPVAINVFSLIINLVLGVYLGGLVFRGQVLGIYGLAVAFVIASAVNALLLFIIMLGSLSKQLEHSQPGLLVRFEKELWVSLWKIIFASVTMGLVCYGMIKLLGNTNVIKTDTVLGILVQSGLSGLAGLAVFLVTAHILKIEEIKIVMDFLGKFLYTSNSNKAAIEETKR